MRLHTIASLSFLVAALGCGTTVDAPGASDGGEEVTADGEGEGEGDVSEGADDEAEEEQEEEAEEDEEEEEEADIVVADDDGEDDAAEAEEDGAPVDAEAPSDEQAPDEEAPSEEAPGDAATTPTATTTTPAPLAVERAIKVLHWNIAGGKENGCQTEGITRAVVRYVREHDVDFVGLNEVCPAQYDSIRKALQRHWGKGRTAKFSAYVGDGDGNHAGHTVGNAIFSKKNLEDVLKLKVGEDQFGNRNLLCARVKNKPHLRFCSAHLTPGDAAARRQLVTVKKRIERFWTERKDTVILAGDLNLNADDRGLDILYSENANTRNNGGNRGKYREADDADDNNCRGYGEQSHAGNGGPCGRGGKIDFVFARQNRIVDGDHSGDTLNIPQDCTGVCSDHRAVVGRYTVKIRVDGQQ